MALINGTVADPGHDSVPWDLLVQMLAEGVQAAGDQIASVSLYDEIRGSASGGGINIDET